MGKKDPCVDAYIEKSAEFARPILKHIRAIVHEACPDCVEEMKWSFPHFTYKGMLASMASFKQHCTFGYWKGSLVVEEAVRSRDAMGQLGRIARLSDLPPKATLVRWTKRAMALNDAGTKVVRKPKVETNPVRVPPDLLALLSKNRKAQAAFSAFAPSKQRDYIDWITGAKSEATRKKRLATSIEWLSQGKSRNWKYEK